MLILASWKPYKRHSWPHFSPLYHPMGEEKLEKRNFPLEKRNYLLSPVSLLPVFLELSLMRLSSPALVWNSSLSCYHDLLVAKPNGHFSVLILLDLLGASETQGITAFSPCGFSPGIQDPHSLLMLLLSPVMASSLPDVWGSQGSGVPDAWHLCSPCAYFLDEGLHFISWFEIVLFYMLIILCIYLQISYSFCIP